MSNNGSTEKKSSLLSTFAIASLATLAATPALAQTAPAAPAAAADDEIVVTGYRASLQSSTNAKRNAVNFTDSIFAEDIGKFPDTNIAESLNRIPGVQVSREIDGEGVSIQIRGLNTNFTKILLNGAQIAVASSGTTNSQNQNREVDLSLFPTELFARLDVDKTTRSDMVEGGLAGVVNMRSARPFDYAHDQIVYQVQGNYTSPNREWSPRGAVMASARRHTPWGEMGVLGGIAIINQSFVTTGFETIGWTNPNMSDAQCGAAGGNSNPCNISGGNGFTIPSTVPTNAGGGLIAGAPIDAAFLLAHNPGLTTAQIGSALMPRLGRTSYTSGDRDRTAGVLSFQWRPDDHSEMYLDIMGSVADRRYDRIDMDWVGRNGGAIPLNEKVDANNVITSATFANAQFFLEARPYRDKIEFISVNPGGEFDVTDWLHWSVQANYTRSNFFRDSPTIPLVNTPLNQGVTVTYNNTGGDFPSITSNIDLNNPANFTWAGGRVNLQQEKRVTFTKGFHTDFRIGSDENNIRVGAAWDDVGRIISGRDNSAAYQNFVCGGGVIGTPTPQPPCNGSAGSAITQANLLNYLRAGPDGFVTVDFNKFKTDTNYDFYSRTAPENNASNTGSATGRIFENTWGLFAEGNGRHDIAGHALRYNVGVRYFDTDQVIQGPVTIAGVRQYQRLEHEYNKPLPSVNLVYELMDNVNLRFAASRTVTRPNPSAMLPNTNFSDPSAQTASQGNPTLQPYYSTNYDIGGEYYTGHEGYVGVMLFRKNADGFTASGQRVVPFADLGIPFSSLTATQQAAITSSPLGLAGWLVTINTQVNLPSSIQINGVELTWVQPLTFLLPGLGFQTNYTNIDVNASDARIRSQVTGIPQFTYNATGYYDHDNLSMRVSYTFVADEVVAAPPQNGINLPNRQDSRGQWDMSASYKFPNLPTAPQVTLNATNFTDESLRQTFGYDNAAFTFYQPGYTVLLGVRGTF